MTKATPSKKKGPSLAVGRGEKLPVSKGAGLRQVRSRSAMPNAT